MSELNLTIFAYGPDQRRVEVELRPTIPKTIRGNLYALSDWSSQLVMQMAPDMKHNNFWGCEICGEPPRENEYVCCSWVHLPQPRIVVYIHHLCEAGDNQCRKIISDQARLGFLMGGITDQPSRVDLPKPEGVEYPFSSSCCNCKRDETAQPGFKMSRCGRCKLTRYCCVECQTNDWARHKKVCRTIQSVRWVNWD